MRENGRPRRVAVIGGTGWIGGYVCRAYAAQGDDVVVLARGAAGRAGRYAHRRLDLGAVAPGELAELLEAEGVRAVVNTADATNTTDGWDRTDEELEHYNVRAVEGLVAAVEAVPWRPSLVHLGSIHEYGPVEAGARLDENAATRPVGAYARSKLAGSAAVLEAARSGRVDAAVIRPVNVCGPHPAPDTFPGKLARMLDEAHRTGGPVEVTVADAYRDWVDVRDVAEAVVRAGAAPAAGWAFNIGSGRPVHMRAFITAAAAAFGLPPERIAERPTGAGGSTGGWIQADTSAAERTLGWRPRIGLEESLADMCAAHRAG